MADNENFDRDLENNPDFIEFVESTNYSWYEWEGLPEKEKQALKKQFGEIVKEKTQKAAGTTVVDGKEAQQTSTGILKEQNQELDGKGISRDEEESLRQRSATSDQNAFLQDMTKLEIFRDMGIIDDAILAAGVQSPATAIQKLSERRPLNDKEEAEFESRMVDRVFKDPSLFALTPPYALAEIYTKTKVRLEYAANDEEKSLFSGRLEILGARMDELSDDFYQGKGLFFQDMTNIADVYDGYFAMLTAREEDLPQEDKRRQIIDANKAELVKKIVEYDAEWNLSDLTEKNAPTVESRFEELSKGLETVSVDAETLKLVSNFKFYDNQQKPEPQFVDKDGKQSDVWSEGYTIIKGSKLDNMVQMAKSTVLTENLGSAAQITPELLQEALKEQLPETLFAAHVAAQTTAGALEHPQQFTDKKFLNQFVADLGNIEKPMGINQAGYVAAVENQINQVDGYVHRLAAKIGKDSPVFGKIYDSISNLDPRAGDRMSNSGPNKQQNRVAQLKRMFKTGRNAFLTSYAITTVGGMVAADTTLTIMTGGMNKFAGAAIGGVMAVSAAAIALKKWRKAQKEAGKKTGLKAFFSDKRALSSMATSALAATAIGFTIAGNPGIGASIGMGALALGGGTAAITTYQDSRKAGASQLESLMWGFGQAGVAAVAAWGGRAAGQATVEYVNTHHPENRIFQHEETRTVKGEAEVTQEVTYKPEAIQSADRILNQWYGPEHQDMLQARIDGLEAGGLSHEQAVRCLMQMHDAGLRVPAEQTLYSETGTHPNHGEPTTVTTHNMKVLGAGWSEATGVSQDMVKSLAGMVDAQGNIHVTPEGLQAFEAVDKFVGVRNTVGHVDGAAHFHNSPLGNNSHVDANGEVQAGYGEKDNTQWTTYANDSAFNVETKTHIPEVQETYLAPNDNPGAMAMFGVNFFSKTAKKLKDRMGSLLDRLTGADKKGLASKAIAKEETKAIPANQEAKALPAHKGPIALLPETTETKVNDLLIKEYEIVHGIKPDMAETARYKKLVQKEMAADYKQSGETSFGKYLENRMNNFENMIGIAKDPMGNDYKGYADHYKGDVNKAREVMWKLPQENGTGDKTLKDFHEHMAKCLSNDGKLRPEVSKGKLDPAKGPANKVRAKASSR